MCISVVYNNVPLQPGLKTGWGFAAVIETPDGNTLFDTGGDGGTLLDNMERLGFSPADIQTVVLSHNHGDHTGGLEAFLQQNADLSVYIPESFPESFQNWIAAFGAQVVCIGNDPTRLRGPLHSTGEMGRGFPEQALIVESAHGPVLITGCAHPGIWNMASRVDAYLGQGVYLVLGGMHLMGMHSLQAQGIIAKLQSMGVNKVAPSHCTGQKIIEVFRRAWGPDFINGGCGAGIELELAK
ncbi:MAG: MBL fold metallo-hydrolase [Desulfovermiculus sp.]